MIRYNKKEKAVEVVETFSWSGTVLPMIKELQEYLQDESNLESEGLKSEDVQEFVHKDFKKGFSKDEIDSLMEDITSDMNDDEWNDYFSPETSLKDSLVNWINMEFNLELDPCVIPENGI